MCVFVYFGERCETVREFFVRVLRSTGVLCSSNTKRDKLTEVEEGVSPYFPGGDTRASHPVLSAK